MYPSIGTSEGLQTAIMDSPVYDRLLLRYLRRWCGLSDIYKGPVEYDNGNGMFINLRES